MTQSTVEEWAQLKNEVGVGRGEWLALIRLQSTLWKSIFKFLVYYKHNILFYRAGNWNLGLVQGRQVLYHWAAPQGVNSLIVSLSAAPDILLKNRYA